MRKLMDLARKGKRELVSLANLWSERKIERTGPIKVGFLCQYIPAWSKMDTVYRAMQADPRFEPVLLCLPDRIRDCNLPEPECLENETYAWFLENGYPEAVNTLIGPETWLDIAAMDFSYLFYQRPYNGFLPRPYTVSRTSRHSKVCLLMYAVEMLQEITEITLDRDFMAYVSCYFAENTCVAEVNIRRNRLGHRLGLQRTLCLGLPVLESLLEKQGEKSPAWDFSRNGFRAIWTPRWTTDLASGGSNFFTYYESLTDYAESHPDMDFLYRPHPLTFAHFLETGEMTQAQVDAFRARIGSIPNLSLDTQPRYDATFWDSSVLISDYSSMVPEYFLTGKPIIFCTSNLVLTLSAFGEKILEGCYRAANAAELFACLDMLKRGEDPLKNKRLALAGELYGSNRGVCGKLLEALGGTQKKRGETQ